MSRSGSIGCSFNDAAGMTYAPAELLELRAFLAPLTKLSAGNLGIVGDQAHATRGTSYHLGRDQLTSDAYSRQTARDRAGLTNAASAIDIGNHPDLRRLSKALVAACQRDAVGTRDIREVIYSPDGTEVLRWDRERGFASKPWPMLSTPLNNTHRYHTHISWYRDSEKRDKLSVFRPLYASIPDTSTEPDMPAIAVTPDGTVYAYIVRVAAKTVTYGPTQGQRGSVGPKADGSPFVGNALGVYVIDGIGERAFRIGDGSFVLESACTSEKNGRDVPVVPAPEPVKYPVTVGGKSVGEVELP